MNDHPLMTRICAELHARPFIALEPPTQLWHLALTHDATRPEAAREHLARLAGGDRAASGRSDSNHVISTLSDRGGRRLLLKWERHAEFCTWTFWLPDSERTNGHGLDAVLDPGWIAALPGDRLVSVFVDIQLAPPDGGNALPERSRFDPNSLCGARMADGETRVWTDLRPDACGFSHFLVRDDGAHAHQLGRRVQRLLEMETYRNMALLGLPLAQEADPAVTVLGERLAAVMERMRAIRGLDDEKALLGELMALSAEAETLRGRTAYRFSATRAYHAIVDERLERLSDTPLGDLPTLSGFINRRLVPAMRTCENVAERLKRIADRIARAADLLRTRVDLALEEQNRSLLESMERRARLQLRLQETVEGLSVAAISYYLVGLVGYLAKGARAGGVGIDVDLATGASVPLVVGLVWLGLRRFRRRLARAD